MNHQDDLGAVGRAIVDGNHYLILATADGDGRPWASPVFYASEGYTDFYWISSPEVTHSRNLARRPQVSMVVFDSRQPPGTGRAVYMDAVAVELAGADLDRGLEVYPGPAERGGRPMATAELLPPNPYRLYRATVSRHWMLCPRTSGPCEPHGRAFDHRTRVTLSGPPPG